MRIALLCPTRKRPQDVDRLIKSLEGTSCSNNIALYLGIDNDDSLPSQPWWVKEVPSGSGSEFIGLGKIWNNMMKYVSEDILAMVGDDMVFLTKEWDYKIINEFENDKNILVHCNDGMRGEGNPYPTFSPFAVAPFIHRRYYDIFGYYTREEWKHGYHDTWLNDVYEINGKRRYRHDIMIRHLHVSNPQSKSVPDETTHRLNRAYESIQDPPGLYNSLYSVREAEAKRLCE